MPIRLIVLLSCPLLVLAQRVSFGVVGGTNITRDFPISRSLYVDSSFPNGLTAFDLYSDGHNLIAGPTLEVALTRRLSIAVSALHRNLYLQGRLQFPDGQKLENTIKSIGTWEWPILLKYRIPRGRMQPFLEAGPSFRTRHDPAPSEPSQFGATVGAGMDVAVGRLRLSPTIRFTRWGYDGDFPRIATKRDQIELLTAVTFASSPRSWRVGGKKIWLGAIAGTPLTKGLPNSEVELPGYMAGVAVEWELTRRLSIEADGLYRPLRAPKVQGTGSVLQQDEFTVVTWQFPVLAKYRMRPLSKVQPIIEAGPSFRLSGNRNGYLPSPIGFTGGVGGEIHTRGMKIGPLLRYTRWAPDANVRRPWTRQDQVELLVTFSF